MHVVVSWDILAEGEEWSHLNEQLKECLEEYFWVKPLSTLYIVEVADVVDREAIREALLAICKQFPKKIHVLLSPALDGGGYSGWLPKSLWPEIKKRTGAGQ